MTDIQKGVFALVLAYSIWGLSPLFFKALDDVPPFEVLTHRVIWSFVLFAGVLAVQ